MIQDYIRSICSIIVTLVLLISIASYFNFGYDFNGKRARECAIFFDDIDNFQSQLYYRAEKGICCRNILLNDAIIEECDPYG